MLESMIALLQRVFRGKALQLAVSQTVNVGVVSGLLDWSSALVAAVNAAFVAWVVVAQAAFEVDLHKLDSEDRKGPGV